MFENVMKLFYLILGFIYSVALYSFMPKLFAFFDQTDYFAETTSTFPTDSLILFALHLVIPAFVVSLIDKVLTLLQWEEENSPFGLVMEALSFSIPAMFRGILWSMAIIIVNLALTFGAKTNIIKDALESWPFPL